ncbi:serine/threonine-protein phosphatase Pgam5, mitochondrial isoform X7 [Maniola hyperantus]|uniref:serine/threonine-protein phosphatase Pgam5, mitochondrial isoform X7 n=1 Tax=Aphantopus hyperantus TaxID=2795564 RepID=UPI003747E2CB
MATFSRLHKIALLSLGAVGGSLAYYHIGKSENRYDVKNSWTTNYTPSVKWDNNWDHREPESIVKPPKSGKPEDENRYNEQIEKAKAKAVRHLFLIRHGQYNLDGATDKERVLTELGRQQADLTGKRLASLDIKWDLIVRSTMTRAQETAKIIEKHLAKDIQIKDCQLLEEGAPVPPEPPVGHWRPEPRSAPVPPRRLAPDIPEPWLDHVGVDTAQRQRRAEGSERYGAYGPPVYHQPESTPEIRHCLENCLENTLLRKLSVNEDTLFLNLI